MKYFKFTAGMNYFKFTIAVMFEGEDVNRIFEGIVATCPQDAANDVAELYGTPYKLQSKAQPSGPLGPTMKQVEV